MAIDLRAGSRQNHAEPFAVAGDFPPFEACYDRGHIVCVVDLYLQQKTIRDRCLLDFYQVTYLLGGTKIYYIYMAKEPTDLDDLKELLEETLHIAKENHHLLKAMRRDAWIGAIFKIVIWLVVIGISVYVSLTFIEPLIGGAKAESPDVFKTLLDLYQGTLSQ